MNEFEKLLQENLIPLQRYVNFKISDRHDAEDVIQDVCLCAALKFDTLSDPAFFKAWLVGIAKHKCADYYRLKAARPDVPLDSLPESALGAAGLGITEHSAVRDTLDALGGKEKQILYLYFFRRSVSGRHFEKARYPRRDSEKPPSSCKKSIPFRVYSRTDSDV